jgi:hypothetical protein
MPISYLEAAKLKSSEAVYARGIKYYLFQKIKSWKDLPLPFWRQYEVKGENQVYTVRFPIAHRLLEITSLEHLAEVVDTHTSCNCQYFIDYGICKHIVAVCNEIDVEFFDPKKDFKLKSDAKEIARLQSSSVLDNIFGIEKQKKFSEYISYLFKPNTPSYLTREMVIDLERELQPLVDKTLQMAKEKSFDEALNEYQIDINAEPKTYPLAHKLLTEISPKLGYYKEEKDLYVLLEKVVYFWQSPAFCLLYLSWQSPMTVENQAKHVYLLYRLSFTILSQSRWSLVWKDYLSSKSLAQEVVDRVLELLESDFGRDTPITVAFAIWVRYSTWLETNLELLQNNDLLEIIKILPDRHEEIDRILRSRALAWIDYLPANTQNYQELSHFLHEWANILGSSEYLDEVLEHLRLIHTKKKSLLALVEDLK